MEIKLTEKELSDIRAEALKIANNQYLFRDTNLGNQPTFGDLKAVVDKLIKDEPHLTYDDIKIFEYETDWGDADMSLAYEPKEVDVEGTIERLKDHALRNKEARYQKFLELQKEFQ